MQLQGKELVDKIRELISGCVASSGLELVEINYYYIANRLVLRIFIDRPEGGVSINECAQANRQLGDLLDSSGLLEQSYTLEVSSPGIDRALKTRDDFKRVINRKLMVFLKEPVKEKTEIHGVLKKIDEGFVYIDYGQEDLAIPYEKIVKAKQIIE